MNLKNPLGATAYAIAKKLTDSGHQALFAGGCVRDHVMGKDPQDYDIATSAKPEEIERSFEKTVPVGKQFGVILVVEKEMMFEVATFRKEGGYTDGRHPTEVSFTDAKQDALRRDFTVNGLFYDPIKSEVLDYVEGGKDIAKKLIRAIGDPKKRFEEDKLRILRAVRFASSLGFEIERDTWTALCDRVTSIHEVSPERIREELVKMLIRPRADRGLQLLSESGLLKEILPEIEAMKGVEQQPDYHPEGDVFIHTGLLLKQLENPTPVLSLAALFHDVGKPVTYQKVEGKIRFYEHESVGAEMTRKIMKRLRFSNDEIEAVCECVANHMKFASVQQMRSGKLKRFVSRPTFPTELELHRIDCQASHGMLENYYFLNQKLKEYEAEDLKPKPWLNGNDLIHAGMKPGPDMKPLLEEAYDRQLEGQLSSREEALEWLKKRLQI